MIFNQPEWRVIETNELNLVNANFIQFYIHFDCNTDLVSWNSTHHPKGLIILLEYSVNGGIEWNLLEMIRKYPRKSRETIHLPHLARSQSTKLRWSQVGISSYDETWALDEVYIGGEYYSLDHFEEDFSMKNRLEQRWLLITGAILEPSCRSRVPGLHFIKPTERMAMTKDIRILPDMYLQYEISIGCQQPPSCSKILLQYSGDYGITWNNLPKQCLSNDAFCNVYIFSSEFLSQATGYRRRVTIPLDSLTNHIVRFRWTDGGIQDPLYDWSLHWIFIGGQCSHCGGRGRCRVGICDCDDNWTGHQCDLTNKTFISNVRETFTTTWNINVWSRIMGATISSVCGRVHSGKSLHFHETCSRFAETNDLDLRRVRVVQFHFRAGCGKTTNQGQVHFQYSTNGGLQWKTALLLLLREFQVSRLVSYILPADAQMNGVKFRWWQPNEHNRMSDDWAIDSLIIGSPLSLNLGTEEPKNNTGKEDISQWVISDTILNDPDQMDQVPINNQWIDIQKTHGETLWWRRDNSVPVKKFCKREGHIMTAISNIEEEACLETTDFFIHELKSKQIRFTFILGQCEMPEQMILLPAQFQVSYDHGVTWELFHPLKLFGQPGGGPQIPSVFFEPYKWRTYIYSLDSLSGTRFVRFRWLYPKTSHVVTWAISDIFIGTPFLLERQSGLSTFMDTFNDAIIDTSKWDLIIGGQITYPLNRLGDGRAALFQGSGLRLIRTVDLDLRNAEVIQFILHFLINNRDVSGTCSHLKEHCSVLYLQCSNIQGMSWTLLQEFQSWHYMKPTKVYAKIPKSCKHTNSLLQWWQPYNQHHHSYENQTNSALAWAIDNILIERSENLLWEIYDSFRTNINQSNWQFYPNGAILHSMCHSDNDVSLNFNVTKQDEGDSGITSQHITIHENYAAYFQIKTGCGEMQCHNKGMIQFEKRQGFGSPNWSLVRSCCLPTENNPTCMPHVYHDASVYGANIHYSWQRVIIPLQSMLSPMSWQFRWAAKNSDIAYKWALKDVYIGPMCPFHCHGNGDCIHGECKCDDGYEGTACLPSNKLLQQKLPIVDHFDGMFKSAAIWNEITGGNMNIGCGSFLPLSHGKHLHFDGCGWRRASTMPFSVKTLTHVAFVLRTGTNQQLPSCRIQSSRNHSDISSRSILLQYTFDGVQWLLLATHAQSDFIQPRRLMYSIPLQSQHSTIRFRWWQPQHGGQGWDQWALDNVEFLP